MKKQRKSSLSPYHVLLVVGKILRSEEGRVYGNEFVQGKKDSGYVYTLLKKMVEFGLLTRGSPEIGPADKGNHVRFYYQLTDKGRRLGELYCARTIAANPPLIPFEDFK